MTRDLPFSPDIIIVGSGPAGVSAAWPLVRAGHRVLMLDAAAAPLPAAPPHPTQAAWRGDPRRWAHELGREGALADPGMSPKFATPLARAVLAGFEVETHGGYVAVGAHAAGGLSRIWGALAARWSDADLAAFGCEAEAIRTGYAAVAQRIGVSDTPRYTAAVARIAGGKVRSGLHLVPAPNAVLDSARDGRGGCTACGLCLHGCASGAIYHAAQELPALMRFANFAYHAGIRVDRIDGEPHAPAVYAGDRRFAARSIVLAAGTLATTGLALRRLGLIDTPVRLESNPVAGMAFLVPGLIGRDLPGRSFGLGQLLYAMEEDGVETAGVFYGADTLPLATIADRLPVSRRYALKAARALAPALVLATGYLPGRFSANRFSVDASGRLRVEARDTPEAAQRLRRSFRRLAHHVRARGVIGVPGSLQMMPPGADAHPAGTLPIGGDGPAHTLADGQLAGAPGVYIADGAALPTLSARHPTLTIMANADRIATGLARRLTVAPGLSRVG
ncbi:choline dehydrogenase-like flavoprotein [Sphingomonas sp. BE138]|uniref:GMC oxidoreductase n=1 Tax=Sphingomonas sp. BE138 TaxID=2817845 RepID=UPI00285EA650|nr:GMC oxidoreductase [Sphingomonas sp. BE138]MDR6789742.1 choline dehydrogenase-like flavoprotein [Sphingomonas sp. BE138]